MLAELKEHKTELLFLLEPQRTTTPPCPDHWLHILQLPAKHEPVTTTDEHGNGTRWRCCLFGRWFIIHFMPNRGPEAVDVTGDDRKHRAFDDLHEFYKWCWAEAYAPELHYRETN